MARSLTQPTTPIVVGQTWIYQGIPYRVSLPETASGVVFLTLHDPEVRHLTAPRTRSLKSGRLRSAGTLLSAAPVAPAVDGDGPMTDAEVSALFSDVSMLGGVSPASRAS